MLLVHLLHFQSIHVSKTMEKLKKTFWDQRFSLHSAAHYLWFSSFLPHVRQCQLSVKVWSYNIEDTQMDSAEHEKSTLPCKSSSKWFLFFDNMWVNGLFSNLSYLVILPYSTICFLSQSFSKKQWEQLCCYEICFLQLYSQSLLEVYKCLAVAIFSYFPKAVAFLCARWRDRTEELYACCCCKRVG